MRLSFPILLVVVFAGLVFVTAQNDTGKTPTLSITKPDAAANMIDEFGMINSEERSSRFDNFFARIAEHRGSTGYVFLFCGKTCKYDEIVAHMRGIEAKISLRGFYRSRIVIQNAGFRESFWTELWLVPAEGCLPSAKSNVPLRDVKFIMARKRTVEHYECCGS